MPIYSDKATGCWRFSFNRVINGKRFRATKLLPKGWTKTQAQAWEQKETTRLYALAAGQQQEPLIEDAVLLYIKHRLPELESGKEVERQLEADFLLYLELNFLHFGRLQLVDDSDIIDYLDRFFLSQVEQEISVYVVYYRLQLVKI